MICTAAATHPESYSTTGRGSYKPYTSATCVCLPTRPSLVPRLPLFSAGSGMLAPCPPVPTVLTPPATYPEPNSVARLRSFIGAYKVLFRVIPKCSSYLAPLDAVTAGRPSQESISWTDDLRAAFRSAQNALFSALTITLHGPEDQLWIVTDGAVRDPGIGATLDVTRGDKLHVSGFFSAKLRGSQTTWLPCEVEALSTAAATKHFSPYLIQSFKKACILTDSTPCVQAYEKLCRGEFSASPRVSTFLSVVSRYQASVRHVSGAAILPSDFASRNAAACENETCQVYEGVLFRFLNQGLCCPSSFCSRCPPRQCSPSLYQPARLGGCSV